ncbi:hypothetical protein G6O69_06190 [Pseudenhygromyxa sp. WMMC2535]|uniref:hypothetical protein n=1 Tax=Pseudenhygromyxa sp. WMMC2535 TaxID=2712867 RepID=UPI0015581C61|nr:hypothetical protein [Pseudenhygromyxa sp. WMMC2535]NVB37413.1 hypothetical protein [Pseudenhygromyxa sp. WMMC2535]
MLTEGTLSVSAEQLRDQDLAALLVLAGTAALIATVAKLVSERVESSGEDDVRREVEHIVTRAARRARSAENYRLSPAGAFVHGLGDLIDFYPDAEDGSAYGPSPAKSSRRVGRVAQSRQTG